VEAEKRPGKPDRIRLPAEADIERRGPDADEATACPAYVAQKGGDFKASSLRL
jgi:hypothetical protein